MLLNKMQESVLIYEWILFSLIWSFVQEWNNSQKLSTIYMYFYYYYLSLHRLGVGLNNDAYVAYPNLCRKRRLFISTLY